MRAREAFLATSNRHGLTEISKTVIPSALANSRVLSVEPVSAINIKSAPLAKKAEGQRILQGHGRGGNYVFMDTHGVPLPFSITRFN